MAAEVTSATTMAGASSAAPVTGGPVFLAADEAAALAAVLDEESLIGRTLRAERQRLEAFLAEPVRVPGSGPGGGPEHEQHKLNYQMLFVAGRFWQMLGDRRHAERVRDVLLAYAARFEALPFAVPHTPNPPGRLFHQILNEHMWLLFASAAYGSIRDWLPAADRTAIEGQLFEPMVEMFTRTYAHHFDIIHNHGMWASGAVGIAGLATGRADWVDLAIHGRQGDDVSAGFLAQLSALFSPSGYYEEGPYYQRFAIQPMLLFAEALERARPELGIYRFRDHVVRRGFYGALASALPDGTLLPLNDALKRMNIDSLGYVLGASLMFRREGTDDRLLWLANRHGAVWPDAAGLMLSRAAGKAGSRPVPFSSPSVELSCGPNGEKGAIGVLRMEDGAAGQAVASLDYGTHGLAEHAHFDGLTLGYFAGGREILRDYGSVRWINMEPKRGGSYLPENISFAKQTIAHNTVTVDETTQNGGDAGRAARHFGRRVQFAGSDPDRQMMTGEISGFDPGVTLRRTALLLRHEDFEHPLLIDLLRITADRPHRYDYALYYEGQIVRMAPSFSRAPTLEPLGQGPGYRHLWKLGEGALPEGRALLGWMQSGEYVSLAFAASAPATLMLTRLGANDPDFNLRPEAGMVFRAEAQDMIFASVVERHGAFDEASELSVDARGQVTGLEILHTGEAVTVLRLPGHGHSWHVALVHNENVDGPHEVTFAGRTLRWEGPCLMQRES